MLFLDYASNVIGAANGSDVSFEQMGILESLSGQKSKVRLLSGLTVEMDANVDGGGTFSTPDGPLSNYYKMLGQLVTVRENTNKKLTLGSVSYQRTDINPWNVETAKIGSKDVSPKVKVYEQVQDSAPLREIEIADIPKKQVPSSDIRYILSDSAGRVQTIVLGDVTGEGYSYGIITGGTETITEDIPPVYDPTNPSIVITPGYSISKTVTAVNLENSDGTQSYHPVTSSDVVNGPGAIAKGMKDFKYIAKMPVLALRNEGVVALDAFDGIKGVRTKSGYIELADKVEVYSPSMQKFISLGEAKANFKEFTIYTDKEYYNGGKVRVIYAK